MCTIYTTKCIILATFQLIHLHRLDQPQLQFQFGWQAKVAVLGTLPSFGHLCVAHISTAVDTQAYTYCLYQGTMLDTPGPLFRLELRTAVANW